MSELELADVLRRKINFNQLSKALRRLKSLNLVVIKAYESDREVVELHPVVRAFIKGTFAKSERFWYIDAILAVYTSFVEALSPESFSDAPSSAERWTEAAELYIERGRYREAFKRLAEVRGLISKGELSYEFIRVAKLLFASIDWKKHRDYPEFDEIFNDYFDSVAIRGRHDDCNLLLENYRETVPKKDARYINFCDRSCYYHWLNENYLTAVKWGSEGAALKKKTDVDTNFDAAHNLALAQRDSGAIDLALAYFLHGSKLEKVIDPAEFGRPKDGSYYGNIGRCLHLMGQIKPALICYRKSAIALEAEIRTYHVSNQGYIRQWIGDLLLARGDEDLGVRFLLAAIGRWQLVSPPKVSKVISLLEHHVPSPEITNAAIVAAENVVRDWIYRGDEAKVA